MVIALIGPFLAVVFEYIPWIHRKYNNLSDDIQKAIMLGLIGVIVFGSFGLSCVGVFEHFNCSPIGFWQAVTLFFLTLAANQGLHRALPRA